MEIFGASRIIVTEAPKNLTVTIAANSVLESAGAATATVTRSGSLVGGLVVTLTSSDTTEATVPLTVTIPNGQASFTFNVSAVNDTIADGTQTVVISAAAAGYNKITDSLDVTDNEIAALTVVIAAPKTFTENSGPAITTGTVTRNSPTNVDLVVNLLSSDTSEVRVPATVTIPAGQASVTFAVDAFNDPWIDGTQVANITAYASGFLSGSDTVTILDDGVDTIPQSFAPDRLLGRRLLVVGPAEDRDAERCEQGPVVSGLADLRSQLWWSESQ